MAAEIDVVRVKGRIFVMSGESTSSATRIVTTSPRPCARPRRRTMLDYDFMRTAFAAAGIVGVLRGRRRLFPRAARPDLRRPCACPMSASPARPGAVLIGVSPLWGMVGFTLAAGIGMGLLGERLPSATSPSASCWRCRSASACCSCISTPPTPAQATRCCSATCSASTRGDRLDAARARHRQPRGAGA